MDRSRKFVLILFLLPLLFAGRYRVNPTTAELDDTGGWLYGSTSTSTLLNVGIGTTTPSEKLDVVGNVKVTGNEYVSGNVGVGTTAPVSLLDVNKKFNVLSGGNVGIGTTAPLATLQVNNTADQTLFKGIGNATQTAPYLDISTNAGLSLLYQDANGNVGVGTSAPGFIVDVQATSPQITATGYGSGGFFLSREAEGTQGSPTATVSGAQLGGIIMRGYHSGGAFSTANVAAIIGYAAQNFTSTAQGNYLVFGTTPLNSITRAERMRITSAGNVGIGTTNPLGLLVVGDPNGSGNPAFYVASEAGNVGIGVTAPATALDVNGTIKGTGYQSSDGSAGVTVTTCTSFKNGLCVGGT